MPRAPRYPPGKAIPAGFPDGKIEPATEPRPDTLPDPRSLNLGHPSKPLTANPQGVHSSRVRPAPGGDAMSHARPSTYPKAQGRPARTTKGVT